MTCLRLCSVALLVLFCASPARPQWTSDPTRNTAIAVQPADQVVPKIKALPDGGCYVSWYDTASGGYDLYLQRLDANGVAQWAAGGIRIGALKENSAQDYGLDVDQADNALLAFRDDRSGSLQITVTKVSPAGVQLWGPLGVQVSSGADDKILPRVTTSSNQSSVAYWGDSTGLRLQRLDANGAIQWAAGGLLIKPPNGTHYDPSDIHGADNGSVIISFIRFTKFNSPRQLCAGKLDSAGNSLWGSKPVAVFDGGSLQIGNTPPFAYDGHGGAAFSWYTTEEEVFVQRLLANGSEAFAHNGVPVADTPGQARTSPTIAFDPVALEIYAFWREISSDRQNNGVFGQKVDSTGKRKWTDAGAVIEPFANIQILNVNAVLFGTISFVFWIEESSLGQDRHFGQKVDTAGTTVCQRIGVSTIISEKSSLESTINPSGAALLIWSDGRNDPHDVYAQNVLSNCQLGGIRPGEVSPPGASQPLVFIDHDTLTWEDKALSNSSTFNLYRGDVAGDLPKGVYGDCFAAGLTSSRGKDDGVPAIGASFFYLVSGKNGALEGPLGTDSAGNSRLPQSACP